MKTLLLGFVFAGGLLAAGCGDDKGGAGSGGGTAGSGGAAGGAGGSGGGSAGSSATGCPACTKLIDCCKALSPTAMCEAQYMAITSACAMPNTAAGAQAACMSSLTQLAANPAAPAACK